MRGSGGCGGFYALICGSRGLRIRRRRLLRHFLYVDRLAVIERIRGIENDPVRRGDALQDFESSAVIAADGNRLQMQLVVGVDDDGAKTFRAEEQRVDGNLNTFSANLDGEMNLRVAPREEFAGVVRDVDFDAKRAGSYVNRLR